jgi:hypothetical protein
MSERPRLKFIAIAILKRQSNTLQAQRAGIRKTPVSKHMPHPISNGKRRNAARKER